MRSQHLLVVIADLGDIAVLAPAMGAACAALLVGRRRRDAVLWLVAFALCVAVTAALKMVVGPFAFSLFDQTIRGASFPSGHAAVSFVFYDGLAALLWFGSRRIVARVLAVALVVLQALIVVAVYRLHWHPLADMAAGLALGAACLALAWRRGVPLPAELGELAGVAFVVACVVVALHGERLDDRSLVDRVLNRAPPLESSLPAPSSG